MRGQIWCRLSHHAVTIILAVSFQAIAGHAGFASANAAEDEIRIGLNATMSNDAAQSGLAIQRGIVLAIDEINASGGVLGRKLQLVVRDNRVIPARGIDAITDLASDEKVVAIIGGINTPVALASLEEIHLRSIPYLGPWAAGTPIVDNGYEPNFVFRVSARDEFAGEFLIKQAIDRGYSRPGLLLWRTGWGRSNEKAMNAAMNEHRIERAGTEWFNSGEPDMARQLDSLIGAGADVIMLIANAAEGLTAIQNMAARPHDKRLPIISHWGITGADAYNLDPEAHQAVDLSFLQTYSFFTPTFPEKSNRVADAYCEKFGPCNSIADIVSPVGTAHAYDLVYLLKLAIEQADTTDRASVRAALEQLPRYEGLVRVYNPPFTKTRHDALDASDLRLSVYGSDGSILPIATSLSQ